jgi:hypothetical protein
MTKLILTASSDATRIFRCPACHDEKHEPIYISSVHHVCSSRDDKWVDYQLVLGE